VGKALLAYLPEPELEELVRRQGLRAYTSRTITTLVELKRELAQVREQGYAVDNEEFEEGLKCVGAPVRDYSGRVVASISIAGPAFRLTEERIPVLAQSVMEVARELSRELGYRAEEVVSISRAAS
jgi:IclR family acetate operon transcriptional repressor